MTGQDDDIRPVGYDDEVHQPFDVQAVSYTHLTLPTIYSV